MTISSRFCAGAVSSRALYPFSASTHSTGLRLGIQLYTVRGVNEADTPSTLKALYAIGYREVETAGFGRYSAKEFGDIVRNAGLNCPSAHLPMDAPNLDPVFEEALELGASYVTSSVLTLGGSGASASAGGISPAASRSKAKPPASLDDFKKLAVRMNEIGTEARHANLQYAYHNHAHEFQKMPGGGYGYDVLLDETDHDLVKFEIDCGWMTVSGASPVEYMKQYPSRFCMLHIKDFKSIPAPGEHPIGCELGTGFIDYRSIFKVARAIGIQDVFAEQEAPYNRPELESAEIDYAYLHSLR